MSLPKFITMLATVCLLPLPAIAGIAADLKSAEAPDAWAQKTLEQLTPEEKLGLVHGIIALPGDGPAAMPPDALWGAGHRVESALAGLDQESGEQLDRAVYFGAPLRTAVAKDPRYARRVDDMDLRILRSLAAVGVIDNPPVPAALDLAAGAATAQRAAEQGIVLLRNRDGLLPLTGRYAHIAVIGGHADVGVISGGGSSQVAPPQGPALVEDSGGEGSFAYNRSALYMPSSPLTAIKALAPSAEVHFDTGRYSSAAAQLAGRSDVAIVFVTQWMAEASDAPDLSLPQGQDALIAAVAAANPHTIVVLETGGPVLMPWLESTAAVIEAWYPGIRGGEAIADTLFGKVNPSGRLPVTGDAPQASLVVDNQGSRAGAEVVQIYLLASPRRTQQRLLGWSRFELAAGESRHITIGLEPRLLADWDVAAHGWRIAAGTYRIAVGESASDLSPPVTVELAERRLKP